MPRTWRIPMIVLAGLTAAACSGSPQPPTIPATQTPASQPVNVTLTGLNSPDTTLFTVTGAGTMTMDGPCAMNPSNGQFTCVRGHMMDGINLTVRHTFYDAAGNVQPAFDRQTTASVKTETTASGTVTHNGMTMTMSRNGVMTASGLGPNATTHTLNGSENATMSGTMSSNGASGTINSTMNMTTTNLVVPVRTAPDPRAYPLSGTRVHSSTMSTVINGQTRTTTMTRRETFNGTSTVQVELSINGVTQHCTVDLAARTNTCSSR